MTLTGKHVLFVQHAGVPGGSVMSLRYLVEGLVSAGLKVSVVMVETNPEVRSMYESRGASVHDGARIPLFRHTTAGWAHAGTPLACMYQARTLARAASANRRLLEIIERERPDLVHLNSVTLALTARALAGAEVPFAWHVRESPVQGYFGMRREFLRRTLMTCGDEVIFLSESDRCDWVQGARGAVVPNVIPISAPPSADAIARARARYALGPGDRAIAYVGGLSSIKGIFPLLEAVRLLLPQHRGLRIVAPGAVMPLPSSLRGRLARAVFPRFGMARDYERAERLLLDPAVAAVFRRSEFVSDILPVLAATEFLVFPSTVPHFARPVVEAAMIAKPSIGSDLAGVRDLIDNGITGKLVPAGDAVSLAEAIGAWLERPAEVAKLGGTAQDRARERFDAGRQIEQVLSVYRRILESHGGKPTL